MKLNHLNLAVPDVALTREFFEQFFGLRCTETKGDNVLSVLVDDGGFALILTNFEKRDEQHYPRDFHLGFIQESVDQVNQIYQRMKDAGVEVRPPRSVHGGWGFY